MIEASPDSSFMPNPEMTPLALFLQVGLVGEGVTVSLLCLSIWCWVLIVEVWWAGRRLARCLNGDPSRS
jgi:hypothetical protein